MTSPTSQAYSELQRAYEHFNAGLFQGGLPTCLITLQREKQTCGYYSRERFGSWDGSRTDEIAMNPTFFAVVPLVETMQTLVHEMTHLWQHHFGKPGRGRYHNDQWADKMESLGLMPSHTGQPGGKRTGDCMADYAVRGGLFLEVLSDLLTQSFQLSWYDRFPTDIQVQAGQASLALAQSHLLPSQAITVPAGSSPIAETISVRPAQSLARPTNRSNRLKYSCTCGNRVWGKPGLQILCMACSGKFAHDQVDPAGLNEVMYGNAIDH